MKEQTLILFNFSVQGIKSNWFLNSWEVILSGNNAFFIANNVYAKLGTPAMELQNLLNEKKKLKYEENLIDHNSANLAW